MNRLALVMVNHNGGEETVRSVDSVLKDQGREDLLILVDNGTSDGSGIQAVEGKERVYYIENKENDPFAEATNIGVRFALEKKYKFVGIINPDVRVEPGMMDILCDYLQQNESVGAVSPLMYYEKPENTLWFAGGRIHWLIGWMSHVGNGDQPDDIACYAGKTQYLTGCCWVAPSEVWQNVGLLDPSYGMYAEDVDWSYRSRIKNYTLHVVPGAKLVHRLSYSSGGGRNPFKMTYRTLATKLFFKRFTPNWMKPLQFLFASGLAVFYAIFLLIKENKGSSKAFLNAHFTKVKERIPWPPSQQTIKS